MASQVRTEIVALGPATLTLDAVGVGHVLMAKAKISYDEAEALTGKYGKTPVDIWHVSTKLELELELGQTTFAILEKILQGATRVASGSDEQVTFGKIAGFKLTAMELIVTPEQSAVTDFGLKLWRAVPTGSPEISYVAEQQIWKVTFRALIHEDKADGQKLGIFGNLSVSADTTAPTVTTYDPADGDTGEAVSVSPTITWAEAMDQDTITSAGASGGRNILLMAAAETGVQAPVACTITHDPVTHITTINPDANLSGATQYNIILNTQIKDISGNRFAGAKIDFTTT